MKPIYNIDGRQDLKVAIFEVTATDFEENDNVVEFEVEPGSVLLAGRIKKVVAFDGTTDVLDFGTTDTPTRYGSDVALKDTAGVAVTVDDAVLGSGTITNKLRLTRQPTGTPTAGVGRIRVWLQLARLGKADTTQGNASAPSVPPNPGPHFTA
ncbi:MAG TPA: hypothetical protein VGK41_01145 [Solirubrobacterales bacterium]